MNTYSFHATCVCPKDTGIDSYLVTLTSGKQLWCEDIEQAVESMSELVISQEDYAQEMSRRLGCAVRVEGQHGSIRVVCEWGAA